MRSLSGPLELSDILDTPSPLIRVNACMYEYMPHMCIFVIALSNMPLIMLCMFPHGLYSLLDYEINLSYLSIASFYVTYATNADPDQTPQNAASDQNLHFLLTGCSIN